MKSYPLNARRLIHTIASRPNSYLIKALFCLCLATSQYALADESKKITFSCWISEDLPAFITLEKIYRESFAAIGYQFTMVHQPAMRSIAAANQGITDGECARIANYLLTAPGSPLERVDVMIARTNLEVWSHDKTIKFNGPLSLMNSQYEIAYAKGAAVMELLLARLPLKNLQEVSNTSVGIKMLARKRFDILISPQAIFKQELARSNIDVELYLLGSLMILEGHPYLHRRHHDILPAFTAELRKHIPPGGLPLP